MRTLCPPVWTPLAICRHMCPPFWTPLGICRHMCPPFWTPLGIWRHMCQPFWTPLGICRHMCPPFWTPMGRCRHICPPFWTPLGRCRRTCRWGSCRGTCTRSPPSRTRSRLEQAGLRTQTGTWLQKKRTVNKLRIYWKNLTWAVSTVSSERVAVGAHTPAHK